MKNFSIKLFLALIFLLFSSTSAFAQLEGITPTPDLINPQGSRFCTEFEMEHNSQSSSDELYPTPAATPASSDVLGTRQGEEDIGGELIMTKEGIPDFSLMDEDLTFALEKLLPQSLKEMFSITGDPLVGKAKHFVLGKQPDGTFKLPTNRQIPETDSSYPLWLTTLTGNTKVLCGMFGTCQAGKSLVIKVQPFVNKVSNSSYKAKCDTNGELIVEKDPGVSPVQPVYRGNYLSFIEDIISDIKDKFDRIIGKNTTIKKKAELKNVTSGNWPASNFRQQSSFQNTFIPADFLGENGTLMAKADFSVSNATIKSGTSDKVGFPRMGLTRLQRCLQLCSIYPSEFDISSIDPLCPSCDKTAFNLKSVSGLDDPVLDMSLCQRAGDGSCDYCLPIGQDGIGRNCGEDPVCEGGKCCPMQFRQAKDYTDNGCPLPYNASDCTDSSVCRKMIFEQNPDGGFGNCQYQNAEVCVRTDREDVDSCAAVCNWACCAYQYGDF